MKMCYEMRKLRKWLDDNKIPYKDNSEEYEHIRWYMHRTLFYVDGNEFSVINGHGSYGGESFDNVNEGLLECWVNKDGEPEGYLTADDVIQKINDLLAS